MRSSTDKMLEAMRICYFHPDLIIPRMLAEDNLGGDWVKRMVYEEFLSM